MIISLYILLSLYYLKGIQKACFLLIIPCSIHKIVGAFWSGNQIVACWRGASDSVTDSLTFSNPADAQNVSCLGLCGSDICPKSSA